MGGGWILRNSQTKFMLAQKWSMNEGVIMLLHIYIINLEFMFKMYCSEKERPQNECKQKYTLNAYKLKGLAAK